MGNFHTASKLSYIESNETLKYMVKQHLKGKDLVCYCAPLACHGDILLEIANS